jgi:hypothetical protein
MEYLEEASTDLEHFGDEKFWLPGENVVGNTEQGTGVEHRGDHVVPHLEHLRSHTMMGIELPVQQLEFGPETQFIDLPNDMLEELG